MIMDELFIKMHHWVCLITVVIMTILHKKGNHQDSIRERLLQIIKTIICPIKLS